MSRWFSFNEFTYSATAVRLGIDNTPSKEIEDHIIELGAVLDGLREA